MYRIYVDGTREAQVADVKALRDWLGVWQGNTKSIMFIWVGDEAVYSMPEVPPLPNGYEGRPYVGTKMKLVRSDGWLAAGAIVEIAEPDIGENDRFITCFHKDLGTRLLVRPNLRVVSSCCEDDEEPVLHRRR